MFDTGIWLHSAIESVRRETDAIRATGAEILTCPATFAEIISVLRRRGESERVPRLLDLVRQVSRVSSTDLDLWSDAGRIHAAERAKHPNLGLVDALILATALAEKARLLTTDRAVAGNSSGVKAKLVRVPS